MISHLRAAVCVATLLLPLPAAAHAILLDSSPAALAAVPPGHLVLTLHFNSRVDRARSRLVLVAPDKDETRLPINPGSAADVLATTAELPPGPFILRWQVLATDGHITRGDLPFTVRAP